jgi:GGDEF domain-containing protein
VRPEQVLARVGGDEFVILAPETGSEGAESLASKLRDKIAGYEHRYGDIRIHVGCSVGVAELSREMIRPEQVLARVGGDEFAILAPETAVEGAETLAAKLRDRISGYEHRYGDVRIQVSCSLGVAELTGEMNLPQDLYQAADEALLLSKRNGRNRVAVHAEPAG